MGILTGFLCFLSFCLLGTKGITRKFGLSAADNFFMKLHKPLSAALLIIGLIHLICALSLIKTRHISVYLSGAAILITLVLLITLFHICRDDRLPAQAAPASHLHHASVHCFTYCFLQY